MTTSRCPAVAVMALLVLIHAGAWATGIAGIKAEVPVAQAGRPAALLVEFKPTEASFHCGLQVTFGDGQEHTLRVTEKDVPLKLTHTWQTPGNFVVSASGKPVFRGLRSALPCSGGPTSVAVLVHAPSPSSSAVGRPQPDARDQRPSNAPATAESIVTNAFIEFARDHEGEKAKRAYRQALTIDPDYMPAWLGLAVLLEADGDLHGAKGAFDKVAQLARPGVLASAAKEEALAIDARIRGAPNGESYGQAIARARILLKMGELSGAAAQVKRAQAMDASRWEAHAVQAQIEIALGKSQEAAHTLEMARKRAPASTASKLHAGAGTLDAAAGDLSNLTRITEGKSRIQMIALAKELKRAFRANPNDTSKSLQAAYALLWVADFMDAADVIGKLKKSGQPQVIAAADRLQAVLDARRPKQVFPWLDSSDKAWATVERIANYEWGKGRPALNACVEEGHSSCARSIGLSADTAEDYGNAFEWYRRAADMGDYHAMVKIANFYNRGRGVKKDIRAFSQWCGRVITAAKAGEARAMDALASYTSSCDPEKKAAWARRAADQGHPESYFDNIHTAGIDHRTEKARLERLAAQGHAHAFVLLSWSLPDGADREKAEAYEKAASMGDFKSVIKLASAYENASKKLGLTFPRTKPWQQGFDVFMASLKSEINEQMGALSPYAVQ